MSITDHGPTAHPPRGHAAPSTPAAHADDAPEARRPWTVLVLALVAQVLVVLDISVVNTALPTIGQALDLGSSDLQWLVTAYLLISGGGLLLGGRIADLLPRRRVFLTGMTVFTAASLFSGFAGSAGELIGARAAQGLGAALMTPAALALIMTTYSGAQRATGPGALGCRRRTRHRRGRHGRWRADDLGRLAGHLLGQRPDRPGHDRRRTEGPAPRAHLSRARLAQFDVAGALTVVGGLATLMFGIAGTTTHGWGSARTVVVLTVAVVLLAAFVLIERRASRPLVAPHTWSIRSLVSGTAVMLGVTGLLVGAVFLTSIFLQNVLGYSALRTGLAFLPMALALVVGTHLAGRLMAHTSARNLAAGGLATAAARVRAALGRPGHCHLHAAPVPRTRRPRRGGRSGVRRRLRHGDERDPGTTLRAWPRAS